MHQTFILNVSYMFVLCYTILTMSKLIIEMIIIRYCVQSGDERVNENAGLTVYHTALIREHNRIEDALHEINPQWDGERLYQVC